MGDADLAEENVERVALGLLARLADRHDDPPPVGVLAGAGGLDERRIGDRERNPPGRLAARRAFDVDGDELARSFAVAHHLLRKIAQKLVERAPEGGRARIGGVLNSRRAPSLSGGEDHQRVRSRRVAVDGDRVERPLDRFRQHRLERARRDGRVGEDVSQHGRHVGSDHACPLGDAVDHDLGVAQLDPCGRDLRIGVGGHDRLGGAKERIGLCLRDQRAHHARDPRSVERLADDAGRSHEDFAGEGADRLGGGLRNMGDRGRADAAGESVGVAGIDDQRPRRPMGEMGAAPVDRGRGALGAGEHARDRRRPVEQRHHDVGSPRIANPRFDGREAHAGDRGQGGIGLRRQRRERSGSGHGRFRNNNRSGPVCPLSRSP